MYGGASGNDFDSEVSLKRLARGDEHQFQRLLEKLPAGAYTCDAQGLITYFNPQAVELWGRAPKLRDPVDRYCGAFRLFAGDGAPIPHAHCWMALALRLQTGFNGREIVIERPDGQRRTVLAHANPIHDDNGKLLGAVNVLVDVSERKRAAAAREKLEARLREAQKLEAIGLLAGGVAHDFNNVLALVLGHAELARAELGADNPALQHLDTVVQAALRARQVVGQLLAFSRRARVAREPVPLADLVSETVRFLRASVPDNVELRQHTALDDAHIEGDPAQLHQLLVNLCTNAIHATRERGGHVEVALERAELDDEHAICFPELRPGAFARLSVRDTGHGMSPEVLQRLFEPFFTTKPAGEGTGLGLAVVHGIVIQHGGAIRVDSAPDVGTRIEVWLPCSGQTATPRSVCAPPTRACARILLVDDEVRIVELGVAQLRALGHQVTGYTCPHEALARVRRGPDDFDLLISDLTMPGMSGATLAEEMHALAPRLRVMLSTGNDAALVSSQQTSAVVHASLQKPYTCLELATAIRDVLESTH